MKPALLPLLLVFASCGPSATLYVDAVFQAAAPEVVEAWSGLAPVHAADVRQLPRDAAAELRQRLGSGGTALIGAALTPTERSSLTQEFPRVRLVFFVPPTEANGQADIGIDRGQTWAAVARKAAADHSGATALFPPDVSPEELDAFARTWNQAGGGPLTSLVWPVTDVPGGDPVFQWAGTAAQTLVKSFAAGRTVHTDPGMDRPASSGGLTWRIRREGLGDFLWNAAQDTKKAVYFLPVEAVQNTAK
jgi:hypothetical protein